MGARVRVGEEVGVVVGVVVSGAIVGGGEMGEAVGLKVGEAVGENVGVGVGAGVTPHVYPPKISYISCWSGGMHVSIMPSPNGSWVLQNTSDGEQDTEELRSWIRLNRKNDEPSARAYISKASISRMPYLLT